MGFQTQSYLYRCPAQLQHERGSLHIAATHHQSVAVNDTVWRSFSETLSDKFFKFHIMIPPFFAFEHKKALSQYYISLGRTINKPVVPPKFGYNPHFPAQDKFRCHISVTGEPGEAYYYFSSQLKDGLGIFSIKARTDRLLSENPRCLLFLIIAFVFNFYYYTTKFDRCQDFIFEFNQFLK